MDTTVNHEQIEEMVAVLRDSRLAEMEVRQGAHVLRLRRPPVPTAPAPAPIRSVPPPASADTAGGDESALAAATPITAGLVGLFHALPEPLAEGDLVAARQVLGQIESLRLMNDVLAPIAGRIVRVAVEEGQPVMYGQVLFEVAEAAA